MQISVAGLQGHLCTITVQPSSTLSDAKESIAEKTGIPPAGQCLIHGLSELCSLSELEGDTTTMPELSLLRRTPEQERSLETLAGISRVKVGSLSPVLVAKHFKAGSVAERRAVCEVLGCSPAAASPYLLSLVRYLQDDAWEVREAACEALGRHRILPSEHLLPHVVALATCFEDASFEVQRAAGSALACWASAEVGGQTCEKAASELWTRIEAEATLRVTASSVVSRASACTVLGSLAALSHQSLVLLVTCVKDPSPGVRKAACEALGQVATRRSANAAPDLAAVADCLEDPHAEVREAAIDALISCAPTACVESRSRFATLARACVAKRCPNARRSGCKLLEAFGFADQLALQAVCSLLRDCQVREDACQALLRHSQDEACENERMDLVAVLSWYLTDACWYARACACTLIGGFCSVPAATLAAVSVCAQDQYKVVRVAARGALSRLDAQPLHHLSAVADLLLERDSDVREAACGVLGARSESLSDEERASLIDTIAAHLLKCSFGVQRAILTALGDDVGGKVKAKVRLLGSGQQNL